MTEAHLGRLLPACLHQAIGDVLPERLEYYEEWLDPVGLRNGSIGLAPITAVLGFLRMEGDAYDQVMQRAGTLAAQWTIASASPLGRRLSLALPRGMRARAALRLARRIAESVLTTTNVSTKIRRGHARFNVRTSLFCAVRATQSTPLCRFYQALAIESLKSAGVPATGSIDRCRALGAESCVIAIDLSSGIASPAAAA